ncbi:MAG: hypothetical protein LBQ47_03800 [Endomicrobium sp.]|jgi:hypothetical protein|nr:hypothetical protein [Endomicrobium sp.]
MFNKRNVFDLTHERKLTCDMGKLIPIFCEEVVPTDQFKVKTEIVVRLAPMLAPVMHRVDVFTHFFFVPTRLLYGAYESFFSGGEQGNDNSTLPYIDAGSSGFAKGSLADYFGLPINVPNLQVLAFPFRVYAQVWNGWYRDENLQQKVPVSTGSEAIDSITSVSLLNRNWEKDYFTSALPWTQRGNPVQVSLGGVAPVTVSDPARNASVNFSPGMFYGTSNPADVQVGNPDESAGNISGSVSLGSRNLSGTADLSQATPITINALRNAFQLQRWAEKNARAGVRYIELILSHFGIRSSDARLQRPEFLGGGRSPVIFSEVLQTSSTDDTSPQANMAGHGFSAQVSHEFSKGFEEHGYIIGIMSIMPRTAYQQGVSRMWNRKTRYDFYWPLFSHLGEQAVTYKEIYARGNAQDAGIFGYQGRYDEYRRRESVVCGDFRDQLDYWHLGRKFATPPTLSSEFITASPSKRIFAVTDPNVHSCWIQILNKVKAVRPMPHIAQPGLIDHE